jgi:hypothetical protein
VRIADILFGKVRCRNFAAAAFAGDVSKKELFGITAGFSPGGVYGIFFTAIDQRDHAGVDLWPDRNWLYDGLWNHRND